MFDMKAEIGLALPGAEGPKKIVVRYPTDVEFCDWRRRKKIIQKDLGRRSFQIEPSKPEACDVSLFEQIRVDKEGPAVDEAEAYYCIAQLNDTEVSERPERLGSNYIVKMKVMRKLLTTHTLRVPSVKEMMTYERNRSAVVFGQYGHQEIKINLAAAGELYDSLKVAAAGYKTSDIPVSHKAEVINVLLQEIRAEQEESIESDDLD